MRTKLPHAVSGNQPDEIQTKDFRPFRILEVEIGQPLPDILPSEAAPGQMYERALVLVRLHTRPLGTVEVRLADGGLDAEDCARAIWRSLGKEIRAHMHQDGLPEPATLEAAGLPSTLSPLCVRARDAILANAPFAAIVVATHDRPLGLAP